MKFITSEFVRLLLIGTRNVIEAIHEKYGSEEICSFALYTDCSASNVGSSFNTLRYLKKCQLDDPDNKEYYVWGTADWEFEDIFRNELSSASKYLHEASSGLAKDEFSSYSTQVFEAFVGVLESIKSDIRLKFGVDCIVLFAISDFDDKEKLISWNKRLNSEEYIRRYSDSIAEWIG